MRAKMVAVSHFAGVISDLRRVSQMEEDRGASTASRDPFFGQTWKYQIGSSFNVLDVHRRLFPAQVAVSNDSAG
jgi:hypothetical protein